MPLSSPTFPLVEKATTATPISILSRRGFKAWIGAQSAFTRHWLDSARFEAEPGTHILLPNAKSGALERVIVGVADTPDMWAIAGLPMSLPEGNYRLDATLSNAQATQLALGWALGAYSFTRYKSAARKPAQLLVPKGCDKARVQALAEAMFLARDLINTPANDLLPTQLAEVCVSVAKQGKAKGQIIAGEDLLKQNYPLIYTVGKGSADAPRLADIRWGKTGAPKVTLVGKGVCFDTGGLDIKPSSGMRLMKKDMGGAAVALALAQLVMARGLNVQLRVLIPMVENAVSGNAMRPLDVVKSRKGLTVEIGNTDAEGRLILCDALADADSEKPDLLIDFATLTGAARVALGPEIPAFFTPDDKLANAIAKHSLEASDPLYRLPLWGNYRDLLKSKVADLSNDPESSYGGAITAALYLKEFVEHTRAWVHIDLMAWNVSNKPGRPAGGEAQALRAIFALLEERYG